MPEGKQLHFLFIRTIRITKSYCESKIAKWFNMLLPWYFRKRIFCNSRDESSLNADYIFLTDTFG